MNYIDLQKRPGKPYRSLTVDCDLSGSAIADVLRYLGAADIYHITAGKWVYWNAKYYLTDIYHITAGKWVYWNAKYYLSEFTEKTPFNPVVNLSLDLSLGNREWYITAINFDREEARSVGTEGA